MPHATNIKAFRDADANEPLFRLYTLLVAVELALKDATGQYPMMHDIDKLVKLHFGANLPSTLDAQLTTFQRSLGVLICTYKGASSPLDPAKYPGIRYLQLDADGFAGGTSSTALSQALADAKGLVAELKRSGVLL